MVQGACVWPYHEFLKGAKTQSGAIKRQADKYDATHPTQVQLQSGGYWQVNYRIDKISLTYNIGAQHRPCYLQNFSWGRYRRSGKKFSRQYQIAVLSGADPGPWHGSNRARCDSGYRQHHGFSTTSIIDYMFVYSMSYRVILIIKNPKNADCCKYCW